MTEDNPDVAVDVFFACLVILGFAIWAAWRGHVEISWLSFVTIGVVAVANRYLGYRYGQ